MKLFEHLRSGFVDLFYPRNCVITGEPLGSSRLRYVSDRAAQRFPLARDPRCPTCGHPFFGVLETPPVCHHCEQLHPIFEEGRCAVVLNRDLRKLIHAFKYHGERHLARDIATIIAEAPGFADFLAGCDVVPVPLHPRKERKRGFNQAVDILRRLQERNVAEFRIYPILRRVKDTPSQTRSGRRERMARVNNAFAMADHPSAPSSENIRPLLVFDDVFTTGATLNACARILHRAGFRNIRVAAFAHG